MKKIGIDQNQWKSIVNRVSGQARSLNKIKKIDLSKTDLKPFKKFNNLTEEINSSIDNYRLLVDYNTQQLIDVGERKVAVDKQGAASFK